MSSQGTPPFQKKFLERSLLLIFLFTIPHIHGYDLPLFGPIPKLNKDWVLHQQGTNATPFPASWLVFTNSHNGALLSFFADKISAAPRGKVNRVPWSDWAGDTFPGGYPGWIVHKQRSFTGEWIRNDVTSISVVDDASKTNVLEDALEYTILFEEEHPSKSLWLAHGYALPAGELRLLVQHTSTNAISPALAHEMISGLFWSYINHKTQQERSGKTLPSNTPDNLCRVCDAQLTGPADLDFDADSLDSLSKTFHHYGIHSHPEVYLVRIDKLTKTGRAKNEIEIKATIVDTVKGPSKPGASLTFTRISDSPLSIPPEPQVHLYYVLLHQSAAAQPSVDPQDPLAFLSFTTTLQTIAERHKLKCNLQPPSKPHP